MEQDKIIENLRQETGNIVEDLIKQGLSSLEHIPDSRDGSSFTLLTSPEIFKQKNTLLVVSGIPEEAGVWSYTLLSSGRKEETSMKRYFQMVKKLGWGMIALNPHGRGFEGGKDEYLFQLGEAFYLLQSQSNISNVAILCFSAGGSVAFEFLNQHPDVVPMVKKIILIDSTPPPFTKSSLHMDVLKLLTKTTLYGLIDKKNKLSTYATLTASVLKINPNPVNAHFHGELPNLLLPEVEKHLKELL
jgi:pimeloyl-ACP methyl ester carboxylesterase